MMDFDELKSTIVMRVGDEVSEKTTRAIVGMVLDELGLTQINVVRYVTDVQEALRIPDAFPTLNSMKEEAVEQIAALSAFDVSRCVDPSRGCSRIELSFLIVTKFTKA